MICAKFCEYKCFAVLQHGGCGVHNAPGLTSSSEKRNLGKVRTLKLPPFVKENLLNVEDLEI